VPKVGIEPTLPKERDFESRASASSATSACSKYIQTIADGQACIPLKHLGGTVFSTMRLGIIGLPSTGKTTLFNALTGEELPTGAMAGVARMDVHTAVVDVPDPRLDALQKLIGSKKATYVKFTYADIGGLQVDAAREGLPGQLVNQLEQMDGLLHVVRAFEDPVAPHPEGSVDPQRDWQTMESEFLLHDMLVVERRLARLAEERQKGGRDRAAVDRDIKLFQRMDESLNGEQPLRKLELSNAELEALAGFGLLSLKPILLVVNHGEEETPPSLQIEDTKLQVLCMCAKLEMEIAQLPDDERQAFLDEYEIEEAGRERVLRASFDLLGLHSFFTASDREARAWTLPRGATALEAAGTVHSDMARGFIRAEVIGSEELLAFGGYPEARSQGKLRLEGKDYIVADGEVLQIRFNV
jgi:GTP-binding protein YchF